MAPIKFYKTGQDWDVLSNVTPVSVRMHINGHSYNAASSEAVYQGCKGIGSSNPQDVATAHKMLTSTTAIGAWVQQAGKKIGNKQYSNDTFFSNPDNYLNAQAGGNKITVKEQLMYELCLAKATQNPEMLKALLVSGNDPITENTALASYDDTFWGNGGQGQDKNGRNALGKVWMAVRANLRDELQKTGKIQVREGFSDALAQAMGHSQHIPGSQLSKAAITQAQLNAINPQNIAAKLAHKKQLNLASHTPQRVSTQVRYSQASPQAHDIKSFAQAFCATNPRQTRKTTQNGITYGVSGKTGGFYIEGQDRYGKPINIHIDKSGQIKENGKIVTKSGYADYALSHVSAHSSQQKLGRRPHQLSGPSTHLIGPYPTVSQRIVPPYTPRVPGIRRPGHQGGKTR